MKTLSFLCITLDITSSINILSNTIPKKKPGETPNLEALNVTSVIWQPGFAVDSNNVLANLHMDYQRPRPKIFKKIVESNFKHNHTLMLADKIFEPDWHDLDTRPLPQWYDNAKIGLMLHWGLYSVPAFQNEWFWFNWKKGDKQIINFMKNNYREGITYRDFTSFFTVERFRPDAWAQLFYESGIKYVVLTAKHHDGYALFPSNGTYFWNSINGGPRRDLVQELAESIQNAGLEFGVYYSLYEWYNSLFIKDVMNNFDTYQYRDHRMWPDIKQLVNTYKPSIIWADGEWKASSSYWNSQELVAWLYNESPVKGYVVVNDRWGSDTRCRHGDFYNALYSGKLQHHKWENAFSIDRKSWCYRRDMAMEDILSLKEILIIIARAVSHGGNALINIGPRSDGIIPPIFEERLKGLGKWLTVNGEAIYGSSPWIYQNDTSEGNVWYTCKKFGYNGQSPTAIPDLDEIVFAIYAIFFDWPVNNVLSLKYITRTLQSGVWEAYFLGRRQSVEWTEVGGNVTVKLPRPETVKSDDAWVIKFHCNQMNKYVTPRY